MKTRNCALDIAKAIGIILMIVGHCSLLPYRPYRHFIFTFHMPLFFIISGYLYKCKGIKDSLKRDAVHLMLPYLYTCLAMIGICLLKSFYDNEYLDKVVYYTKATFIGSGSVHNCMYFANVPNIGAIWFFPALYVCKNVYNLLQSFSIRTKFIISSIVFIVAALLGRYVLYIPFSILSGLTAMIFFAIGDILKSVNRIKPLYWVIGIGCWVISFVYSRVTLVRPIIDLYFIDVIGATTASLAVYLLSVKLDKRRLLSPLMVWIGKNSLYILCFHLLDLNVLKISRSMKSVDNSLVLFSMIMFPILATFIFVKVKGWIKNRRMHDRSVA